MTLRGQAGRIGRLAQGCAFRKLVVLPRLACLLVEGANLVELAVLVALVGDHDVGRGEGLLHLVHLFVLPPGRGTEVRGACGEGRRGRVGLAKGLGWRRRHIISKTRFITPGPSLLASCTEVMVCRLPFDGRSPSLQASCIESHASN